MESKKMMLKVWMVPALFFLTLAAWSEADVDERAPLEDSRLVVTLDAGAGGTALNPFLRGQNGQRGVNQSATFTVSENTLLRGVAGGLDADSYDWRDIDSGLDARNDNSIWTTLEFLRMCRDRNATPLFTANVLGFGSESITKQSASVMADLAADWVWYCNDIVQNYSTADTLPTDVQNLISSLQWNGKDLLPSPGEAPLPKVMYWEIGNEPELNSIPGFIGNHYLSGTEYASRYNTIANAMVAVDSEISVGPCIIYPGGTNSQLSSVLNSSAPVGLVGYHPYYYTLYNSMGSTSGIESAIRGLYGHHEYHVSGARAKLSAGGRSTNTPLVASEWNDLSWEAQGWMYDSMAHTLAYAESIFCFARLGVWGANFWEVPGGHLGAFKVMEEFQDHLGGTLVDTYSDGQNLRAYLVKNSPREMHLWIINWDNDEAQTMNLQFSNLPFEINNLKRRTLAGSGGLTTTSGIGWTEEYLPFTPGSSNLTATVGAASLTNLLLENIPEATIKTLTDYWSAYE